METITMQDIIDSNRIKKEACENCKNALEDKLTSEQLEQFDDIFYSVSEGYLFGRKGE